MVIELKSSSVQVTIDNPSVCFKKITEYAWNETATGINGPENTINLSIKSEDFFLCFLRRTDW